MGMRQLGGLEKLPKLDLTIKGEGTVTKVTFLSKKQWQSELNDQMVWAYTVMQDGVKSFFNGTAVLDRILAEAQPGDNLVITYVGQEPSKVKGRNATKIFEVYVDDPDYEGDDTEDTKAKKKVPF